MSNKAAKTLAAGGIVALVLVAFWPVVRAGFVNFDDPFYVTGNSSIQSGLTIQSIAWAFQARHASNWHPLTWISHALDIQIFGLQPMGHHLTNLVLHLLNSVLLFLLFERLTGAPWRSFLVAALFAVHPLHVESVAWVAERKDVLCTLFALLSLTFYARYVSGKGQKPRGRKVDYLLALGCFAASLMSKPMAVTLPFLMLLLDVWPLQRLQTTRPFGRGVQSLLEEKVPFFLLSAAMCVVTFKVQQASGATRLNEVIPAGGRVANAVVSYARYLKMTIWPADLSVFYEHPLHWPVAAIAGSLVLLAGITVAVLRLAKTRRYLCAGWFWFLGSLVPVIGIVQVGDQALADRYMYIPSIGLFFAFAWAAGDLALQRPVIARVLVPLNAAALLALLIATRLQCRYWQSTETLFRHALVVNDRSALAHNLLGTALDEQGRFAEAEQHYLTSLKIRPDFPDARLNYAISLGGAGRFGEARSRFEEFLRESPGDSLAHFNLAMVLSQQGYLTSAVEHYETAVRLKPEYPDALNNLAWIRATASRPELRDGQSAVRMAELACQLTGGRKPMFIGTLAACYAEAGRFEEAEAAARRAITAAQGAGDDGLEKRNQELLALYQKRLPFREDPPKQ